MQFGKMAGFVIFQKGIFLIENLSIFAKAWCLKTATSPSCWTLAVIFQTTIDRQIIKKNKYGI